MTTYIYALHCPISKTVRYIGKSVNPTKRFQQHIYFARTGRSRHHAAQWIRKVLAAGLEPTLEIFYEVKEDEDWREAERFWISEAESFGWRLTNTTAGGDGVEMTCPIAIANWKEAVKARWRDPELRRNSSLKLQAFYSTDAGKQNKIRTSTAPAKVEASRIGQLNNWKNPRYRATIMSLKTSLEVLAKQAEGAKNQWSDPEIRKKMVEGLRRGQQARWARDGLSEAQKEERHQLHLAKRRAKRAAEKAAKLAATTPAPYTESS
jgi:GIY-YIG catalytic domain-containing protein